MVDSGDMAAVNKANRGSVLMELAALRERLRDLVNKVDATVEIRRVHGEPVTLSFDI